MSQILSNLKISSLVITLVVVVAVIVAGVLIFGQGGPSNTNGPKDSTLTSDQKGSTLPDDTYVPEPPRPSRMYLELVDPENKISSGDEFEVAIKVDTMGSNINLVQSVVDYDTGALEYLSQSFSGSVMAMAARDDTMAGRVDILRGAPGDGNADDSDDGFTGNGVFITLTFKALSSSQTYLDLSSDSKVLLDDGRGSLTEVEREGLTVSIN